jgi:hypothetical protein
MLHIGNKGAEARSPAVLPRPGIDHPRPANWGWDMDQGYSIFSAQCERNTKYERQAGVALPTLISTTKGPPASTEVFKVDIQAVAVACCCEYHTTGGLD